MKRYYKILLIAVSLFLALALTIQQNKVLLGYLPSGRSSLVSSAVSNSARDYDLSSLRTLNSVLLYISKCYVDPSRFDPQRMFKGAIRAIEDEVPCVIADFNKKNTSVVVQIGAKKKSFDYSSVDGPWSMSSVLKNIFKFIKEEVGKYDDIESRKIEYAAVNGMLSTLDPHTRLLPPEFYKEMKMDTRGEFGGLGIVISSPEGRLTINEVLEGTPAEKAGLKCGDHIVQIEEESTINMDLDEAVSRLRGKPGTKVHIWIMRDKWKRARQVEVERARIHIESVKFKMLDGGVGYIRLSSFQENTYEDLKNAIEKLKARGLRSIILDLRDNAGGLLDQAIVVADVFLYAGTITTTYVPCGKKKKTPYTAKITGSEPNFPMVVLINRGSASASEIVAGALKNHDRALIMGERSFGKGSIQQVKDLPDGSALKYTIGEYLTPGDISIQSMGIVPDVQLVPMIISKKNMNIFYSEEDVFREDDLDRHLVSGKTIQQMKPGHIVNYVYISRGERKDICPPSFEEIIKDDFEVKLAQQVLKAAVSANRVKIEENSIPLLATARQIQEKELVKVLSRYGVDWRGCPSGWGGTEVKGQMEVRFYQNGRRVEEFELRAGQKAKIKVEVINRAEAVAWRIYGIAKSDNRLFNKREFLFGRIPPGQKRNWETEIEVPLAFSSRVDPVDVFLYSDCSGRQEEISRAGIKAKLFGRKSPRWDVAYEVKDDIEGDGDGIIERGEEGRLLVYVRNDGKGKSKSFSVGIKNLSGEGVFIEKGRESVKDLGSGQEAKVELKVKLLPHYNEESFKLRLSVRDADFPVYYKKDILLPADEKFKGGVRTVSSYDEIPGIYITSTEPDVGVGGDWSVRTSEIKLNGYVEDDTGVLDMYVYLDDEKIFYKFAGDKQPVKKLDFSFTAKLHGGVNFINIFARQDSLTTVRKQLIIRRDNPDGTPMPTPREKED